MTVGGPGSTEGREAGIDAARYLLCLGVVILHILPMRGVEGLAADLLPLATIGRVAVPFFLVASGYYLRLPPSPSVQGVMRPMRRLLPPYLAWLAIYVAAFWIATEQLQPLDLRLLLTGGPGFHLWFLPALCASQIAILVGAPLVGLRALAAAFVAAALIGLGLDPYRPLTGMPALPGTRMLLAPAMVLAGLLLARSGWQPKLGVAAALFAVAWLMMLGEELAVARLNDGVIRSHNAVVTTYLLGPAAFLFARALPPWRAFGLPARLGQVSFGVYAAHLLFVPWGIALFGNANAGAILLASLVVLAAATAMALLLARVRSLRPLVQ